jgi:YVTN family beta-propeller protein
LVADPGSRWLYVVNSNSDLRYNTGTVLAIDAEAAATDRGPDRDWATCPGPVFVPRRSNPPRFCCRDYFDRGILNCDERAYVRSDATVRIGSFGGTARLQTWRNEGGDLGRRLFIAVRGDPSVTHLDVSLDAAGRASLRCGGSASSSGASGPGATLCGSPSQIQKVGRGDDEVRLPEEPFTLALDETLGLLYVGHLAAPANTGELGGVSVIDVCGAEQGRAPQLTSFTRRIFTTGENQSVTSLTLSSPGDPRASIFATSRTYPEIAELVPRGAATGRCGAATGQSQGVSLVPGLPIFSSAFSLRAAEIRSFIVPPETPDRAYVLYRDTSTRDSPPVITVIDRSSSGSADRRNRPIQIVEVCSGATEMQRHDTGRGERLFVTCFESGQIYVVDPEPLTVTDVITVGRGPNTLVFSPTDPGLAYVAGFADNNVAVLDLHPGSPTEYRVIQRIGFPRPQGSQN